MAVDISVCLNLSNSKVYGQVLFDILKDNEFNLLVETVGLAKGGGRRVLKFCGRKVDRYLKVDGGQVSIGLTPGGSLAWDVNKERVIIHFKSNGDIVVERLMSKLSKKIVTCTSNPI